MHRRTYVQFHYLGGDTCQSYRKATAVMTNQIITASCSITIIVASYDVIDVCGPGAGFTKPLRLTKARLSEFS